MAAGKPSGKSSGRKRRDPVPQPHGGALVPGAGGGPQPGSGRPASKTREACRLAFEERIPVLTAIADGKAVQRIKIGDKETESFVSADVGDRIRAIGELGKFGLGTMKEVSTDMVREKVRETISIIGGHVSPDQFAVILRDLKPVWAS